MDTSPFDDNSSKIRAIVAEMMKNEMKSGSSGGNKFLGSDRVKEFILAMSNYAEDALRALADSVSSDAEWNAGLDHVKNWDAELRQKHADAFNLLHESADELYAHAATQYAYSKGIAKEGETPVYASLGDFIATYLSALARVREIRSRMFFTSLGYADRTCLGEDTVRLAFSSTVKPPCAILCASHSTRTRSGTQE